MTRFPFFVVSIFWLGFLVAISFFETPLKFQVESIDVFEGIALGKVLFNIMNKIEMLFLIPLFIEIIFINASLKHRMLVTLLVVFVFLQGIWLLPEMNAITEEVIRIQTRSNSSLHSVYVVFEVLKLIALIWLSFIQVRSIKKAPSTSVKGAF